MNAHHAPSKVFAVLTLFVASLVIDSKALAQDILLAEPALASAKIETIRDADLVTYTLEGTVHSSAGPPVAGAVVVSSAGGQAVSDANGKLRLEIQVPFETEYVQVTAGAAGQFMTSKQVLLPATSGNISIGGLQLTQSNSCTPNWLPTFGEQPGIAKSNGLSVNALVVFDDGSGPALYAGGQFIGAGAVASSSIAKWNGQSWESVGSGMTAPGGGNPIVSTLVVFDDGTGPALFAGGSFTSAGGVAANRTAKWNGSTWAPLAGLSNDVLAMIVFDDGSGQALYAGGKFTFGLGGTLSSIAKWNGSTWSPLGSGLSSGALPSSVNTLAVFDDGGGAALFAGGSFLSAGGLPANQIAKWNGSTWSTLGSGIDSANSTVKALQVVDDGGSEVLCVGGEFTSAGGVPASNLAKWNGTDWTEFGGGADNNVYSLQLFDDGSGSALYVGGAFTSAGGVSAARMAKWNGVTWTPLGNGVDSPFGPTAVFAMVGFDDGAGEALFVGGSFATADGLPTTRIAKWSGSLWTALGRGVDSGVFALEVFDDGSGAALYAGGDFLGTGGVTASRIAKWDGSNWAPLGSGMNSTVLALEVFDDGSGRALYAGGAFTTAGGGAANGIAKWNGSDWTALGGGLSSVFALTVFDDGNGTALYAGGQFTLAAGAVGNRIAKWDGSSWSSLGSGTDDSVHALTVFDDGGGAALYVGGNFTSAGAVQASRIAKWNGSSWMALGSGVDHFVSALEVFDDGGGPALFVGGFFTTAGGAAANHLASWDGSSWSPLGNGTNKQVNSLAVFDDGRGAALFAGGTFILAGVGAANGIAKWDGSNWSPLGSGMNERVATLRVFDDGGGEALYAGGNFTSALDSGDSYLAKWRCQFGLANNYCNGDGGDQLGCTNCPCMNNAAGGTTGGCLNSAATSARLSGSGDTSVSLLPNDLTDLRFTLSGAPPLAFCILISGDALAPTNVVSMCFGLNSGTQAIPFDGLRCAALNTRRHGGRSANMNGEVGSNGAGSPWGGEGGPPLGIASAGGGFITGQRRYFQVVYRDDPLLSCMRGLNTSQAIEATFAP